MNYEVILQGHSLGCDRILHFLLVTRSRHDFILLSPCDSYQLQANWLQPETVEQQISRLKSTASDGKFDWLSLREYGIRQGEWTYHIPVTRSTLLSIMEGPPFRLMRLSAPLAFQIDQRALIYIGGKDELQTSPSDVMYDYLEKRIQSVTRAYFAEGDHNLTGCEERIIDDIVHWMGTR